LEYRLYMKKNELVVYVFFDEALTDSEITGTHL
jgi:hypothetical protein